MPIRSIIIGTGSHVPQRVVTNKDMESRVDTTDEWIRTRTGIIQRHISNDQETNSYLATQAARKALDMAGVRPQDHSRYYDSGHANALCCLSGAE